MNLTTKQKEMQALLIAELTRLVDEVGQRGFFGNATLTLSLQDGRLQHLRVATERMVRPPRAKPVDHDAPGSR